MAGVILGDWTHRRGDAGGTRAISAEVGRAKPRPAWSWEPPHGGRVDQVRIFGPHVYVATHEPPDQGAPGWEHPVIYALEASSGRTVAARALPDPLPVAAMIVAGGSLHIVAAKVGEPLVWYVLTLPELDAAHRRRLSVREPPDSDVLDAWLLSDGALCLEIDRERGGRRTFAFFGAESPGVRVSRLDAEPEADMAPSDACVVDRTLFVPCAEAGSAFLRRIDAEGGSEGPWAGAHVHGRSVRGHAVAAQGLVELFAVALGGDGERALVQAVAVDRGSGVVRHESPSASIPLVGSPSGARLVRRAAGDLAVQCVAADGSPCADLVCLAPGGAPVAAAIGASRAYVLDLALGDAVVAHREQRGRVVVGAFDVRQGGRWLVPRASLLWSTDLPSMGGECSVYAGAGRVVVRGERGLAAIRV